MAGHHNVWQKWAHQREAKAALSALERVQRSRDLGKADHLRGRNRADVEAARDAMLVVAKRLTVDLAGRHELIRKFRALEATTSPEEFAKVAAEEAPPVTVERVVAAIIGRIKKEAKQNE